MWIEKMWTNAVKMQVTDIINTSKVNFILKVCMALRIKSPTIVSVALGIKVRIIILALHITFSISPASSHPHLTLSVLQPHWPSSNSCSHPVPSCPRDSFVLFPLPWSNLPIQLCPHISAQASFPLAGPISWTGNLSSCTRPALRKAPLLVLCSAAPVLKFV